MFSFLLCYCTILLFIWFTESSTITITTKLGNITGTVQDTTWPESINLFAGIRYAVPPINQLRFRQAQLYTTPYDGTYDATQFRAECTQPQNGKDPASISEDCLYLNIWSTNVKPVGKLLPVMFWIHGGFFAYGSGADSAYNGNNIVGERDGEFVYVSINYRLGSLGFLQNEELYSEDANWKSYGGMNGIYDQITALKWVKQNIADFGGDPDQITIFGESAGGISVCYLLFSPEVPDNIFQRAIIESGGCNGAWGPSDIQQGLTGCNNALKEAGYPTNNLTYLRSIDANTFSNNVVCGPYVDGLVLTDEPKNILANLSQHTFNAKDAVMIGWTSNDALAQTFDGYAPTNEKEYQKSMSQYFPNATQANLMENVYFPPANFPPDGKDNNYQMTWYTLNSDACLGCPALFMAQQILSSKKTNNVYIYEFGGPTTKSGTNYAPHGSEIAFVFDHKDFGKTVPWSQSLADSMVSAWTNFGIYGVPNITNTIDKINIVWDPFPNMMVFNNTGIVISGRDYQNGGCYFMNYGTGVADPIPDLINLCNNGAKM